MLLTSKIWYYISFRIADNVYYTYDASDNLVSMNLNGVEYYYIRNAQNDIIGLFDKDGTQVVSYSYDSWGKLISIDGSLKDTVGVKNPYRYRGYRYDTETGLYYLNSRYYNPEWGRFINADALGGQVGDLLSHNVFAYSKNDPINYCDPDGFARVRIMDDAGSYCYDWGSSKTYVDSSSAKVSIPKAKNGITKKEALNMAKNMVKNTGTGYAGYLATSLSQPLKIVLNRKMSRAGEYILIPGSKLAKGIGAGLAIFGVVDTIYTLASDWNDSSSWQEAVGKMAIDGGVFIFSAVAGAVASPLAGAAVGFGLNTLGDAAKNYLWDNK